MATRVEWKATPAVTHGQRKRTVQPTEQNARNNCGKDVDSCPWSTLRAQQSALHSEGLLNTSCHPSLVHPGSKSSFSRGSGSGLAPITNSLQDRMGKQSAETGPLGCLAGAKGCEPPNQRGRHAEWNSNTPSCPRRVSWRTLRPPLGRHTAMNISPWTPRNEPTGAKLLAPPINGIRLNKVWW